MKKKYRLKKSAILTIGIFIIIIIALLILAFTKTQSYSLEYNLNEFAISENFDSSKKLFYYEITYNDIDYNFIYSHKHFKEKKLIKDIKKYEKDEYICLLVDSDYISTYPLCSKDNTLIDFHLIPENLKEDIDYKIESSNELDITYNNYKIYNNDNKILIWSYKGFNYIKGEEVEFIELFSKDIYDIPHATKINNYIVIPDYEQEYNFNQVYIINLDNNEVKKWILDYEISYDSYVLGINDKSIFIIDNKSKREYELVPHKQKMRIVATSNKQGVVYNEGILEKVSMKKLVSSNYSFIEKNNYHYELENNTLYLSYLNKKTRIKVSNHKITSIVYINQDNVYYLVGDTLYKYNLKYGETKLITYSEWQFNNKNLIFIND